MSRDCPNGKVLNSKLVQYDFAGLRRDKMNTYATKVIQSPNVSIRAIWVPKSIVTNVGPTNFGHQRILEKLSGTWRCIGELGSLKYIV